MCFCSWKLFVEKRESRYVVEQRQMRLVNLIEFWTINLYCFSSILSISVPRCLCTGNRGFGSEGLKQVKMTLLAVSPFITVLGTSLLSSKTLGALHELISISNFKQSSHNFFGVTEVDNLQGVPPVGSPQVSFPMCTLEIPQKLQYKFFCS